MTNFVLRIWVHVSRSPRVRFHWIWESLETSEWISSRSIIEADLQLDVELSTHRQEKILSPPAIIHNPIVFKSQCPRPRKAKVDYAREIPEAFSPQFECVSSQDRGKWFMSMWPTSSCFPMELVPLGANIVNHRLKVQEHTVHTPCGNTGVTYLLNNVPCSHNYLGEVEFIGDLKLAGKIRVLGAFLFDLTPYRWC